MESNTTMTTALEPTFGMPAYGPASRVVDVCARADVRTTGVSWTARVRHTAVDTKGAIKGAFAGPDAWSPPIT